MDTGSDDLTLAQAASLARLSPKTLRRAVSRAELPRRYRDTPYGAQLIVSRSELARWLDSRLPRGAAPLPPLQPALADQTTRVLESRLAELAWSVGVLGDRVSELEQRLDRVDRGQSSVVSGASPNAVRHASTADEVFPLPARPASATPGQWERREPWWRRLLSRAPVLS